MKIHHYLSLTIVLFLASGCASSAPVDKPGETTLHVALFPYIPDSAADHFAAMQKRIKKEFESEHAGTTLVLDPIDPISEVFYNLTALEDLMSPTAPTGPVDLLETDTIFLGELIADNSIERWDALPRPGDWHPAAQDAVTVNGDIYGVPHWLCTFFVFSHIPETATAKTPEQLVKVLETKGTNAVHFAGNFLGSFTLPAIYIDAYAETHGPASAATGLARPVETNVALSMKTLTDEGRHDGKNPCLDGSLKDDKDIAVVVPLFANGGIDSFFGYSERLYHILGDNPKAAPYVVVPAPLGTGEPPLLYVDALVLRKGVSQKKRELAQAFAEYINRPATQEWLLLSKDGNGSIPRYLLPATKSAFNAPGLRQDRYYQMLAADIADGHSFPTSGYLERKDALKASLLQILDPKPAP